MEEWKPVPEYEGRYEVSNLGRVRSFLFCRTGRIMKPDIGTNGYPQVHLQFKKTWRVHRLVATMFLPNPLALPVVNHKDGNKRNPAAANLEWSTHSDNMRHSWKDLGTYRNRVMALQRGENNRNSKLTAIQIVQIRTAYGAGNVSHEKLAERFGVSKPAIGQIVRRRTWTHVA